MHEHVHTHTHKHTNTRTHAHMHAPSFRRDGAHVIYHTADGTCMACHVKKESTIHQASDTRLVHTGKRSKLSPVSSIRPGKAVVTKIKRN